MLYWLLYQKLYPFFHPFRIFRYLTFRTAFASGTALLIALFISLRDPEAAPLAVCSLLFLPQPLAEACSPDSRECRNARMRADLISTDDAPFRRWVGRTSCCNQRCRESV